MSKPDKQIIIVGENGQIIGNAPSWRIVFLYFNRWISARIIVWNARREREGRPWPWPGASRMVAIAVEVLATPHVVRDPRKGDPDELGPSMALAVLPPLVDCPCGCSLRTSEPDKLCERCGKRSSAAHWDELLDVCGPCAPEAYGP